MRKALFTLALLASTAALAAAPAPAQLPGALALAKKDGLRVVSTFKAPGGLTGYVTMTGNDPAIVYGTPEGYLLVGALMSPTGANLTAQHAEQYIPQGDQSGVWALASKAAFVTEGTPGGTHTLYVFFDPNCAYCRVLHMALAPYVKAGATVNWIPVGVLQPDSASKAALLLDGKENPKILRTGFGGQLPTGAQATPASEAAVKANTDLLANLRMAGVPVVVYQQGGKTLIKKGMPRMRDLPGITGLPAQQHPEAELARFK